MGIKDTATAKYMRQNEIFADAFNYFVYNGRQVITPDSLEELDTREIDVPYGGKDGAQLPVQRTRDVIRSVTAMTDRKRAYLVLAIENQSNIHYAMAVKNMVYDALQYAKQVERAVFSHKQSGDYKNAGSDDYLSGFMKEDRLMPVVTLVIYFGSKEWDGPVSIHEMFEEQDADILTFVPDYKINLIAPAAIKDDEFDKFHTTLKEVLSFIKYSQNADKLTEIVENNEGFRHLKRNEVNVLNACVNAKLTINRKKEECDVCLAMQTIADRAAEKAAAEAAAKAADEQNIRTLQNSIRNLMERMGWSAEQSMEAIGVSDSDKKRLALYF